MGHRALSILQAGRDMGYDDEYLVGIMLHSVDNLTSYTVFSVFISWFQAHHTFPTSPIQYAWIVGLAVSSAFFISPIATYLCKLLPLRGRYSCFHTIRSR